jgi:hypothetical protein
MFLGGGADAKVVGSDLKQIDFKVTQGHGETRIAAAAGVPPIIVGLSEGPGLRDVLELRAGPPAVRGHDDASAVAQRRRVALATILDVPPGAELWYDDRDIPFLQEDLKDEAEIQQTQANAIRTLVHAGFEPDSVVSAVTAADLNRLKHSGLYSVQLQAPGSDTPPVVPALSNGNGTVPRASPGLLEPARAPLAGVSPNRPPHGRVLRV